ncbi:MAG: endonuclease [Oscillospiraceae bacterium]|nr:endonuclease [Oscillospiraceae bacterium]
MTPTRLNDLLFARYGELNWWPAGTPYEVMVGAVLTQNTAWSNVEAAIARFGSSGCGLNLTPQRIETMPIEELTEIIRPAGFFNQKARYIKALTAWFKQYNYSTEAARRAGLPELRKELLAVRGIGKETADSILLYALELPSFVTDAYTKRLLGRLGVTGVSGYDAVKRFFEEGLDTKLYNNLHAMIVINAKEHCRAKPKCAGCPLEDYCEKGNK